MSIFVREATFSDIDFLIKELRKFSNFFGSKKKIFDEKRLKEGHVKTWLEGMIGDHFVRIAEGMISRERVGFMVAMLVPHFLNPEIRILSEIFWWVMEGHRSGRAGALLFNSFVEFGESEADWISMTIEEKSPVKESSLLRRGFSLHERSYLREVGC